MVFAGIARDTGNDPLAFFIACIATLYQGFHRALTKQKATGYAPVAAADDYVFITAVLSRKEKHRRLVLR